MTQIKTILSENDILTEPQEIAQSIGQYFYSNSSDASLTNDFLKYKQDKDKYINISTNLQPNHGQGSILNEPITLPEIELCLRGKKSKSCGSDKIPFIFLQNLPSSGKLLLLHLYNQIWETGIIPIKWKNAIITPIPKKNQNRFKPTGTSTQIYTDASKTEMGIGLAIVHLNETKQFKLNIYSSIYTAEYLALYKGVQLALQIQDTKIDICSDSLSALANLQSIILSEPLAILISNLLSKSSKDIQFVWIPGHCNIKGNEK
ncbi:hypothetical protein QTP88_013962 [Uroleucon formosanum]